MAVNRKRIARKVGNKVSPSTGVSPNSEIAGIRGAQGKRRKQFVKERDSIKGAARLAANAVRSTNTKGLKGPEHRQLKQEIASRARDIELSKPALLADAQREFKSDRADLAADLQSATAGRQAAIQEAVQEEIENRKGTKTERKTALREANYLLSHDADGNSLGGLDLPKSKDEWQTFERALAGKEGISPGAARSAVQQLRTKTAMLRKSGKVWTGVLTDRERRRARGG